MEYRIAKDGSIKIARRKSYTPRLNKIFDIIEHASANPEETRGKTFVNVSVPRMRIVKQKIMSLDVVLLYKNWIPMIVWENVSNRSKGVLFGSASVGHFEVKAPNREFKLMLIKEDQIFSILEIKPEEAVMAAALDVKPSFRFHWHPKYNLNR